mmetsp:Transcript_16073/g.39365  ORF Transcript_16073/g.39365 Transcript_16073/m.39365 type:complete len:101 (+) Transcript_16073:3739-4041(+)
MKKNIKIPTMKNLADSHRICVMNSSSSGDAVRSVKESENTHAMAGTQRPPKEAQMQPATINTFTRVVSAKLNTSDSVAKGVFESFFCFSSVDLQHPTILS